MEFFYELKDWSKRKLELMMKYLAPATKIMGSFAEVYYVDGFAGAGVYDDGEKGSSVLAAEFAQSIQDKSYKLRCINIEEDAKNFANLQANTQQFGNIVINRQGTFADNVDFVLDTIGNNPAVFFLDPFGVKGIEWDVVQKVINRKDPTDVWIRFDNKTVRRLAGFFDSDNVYASGKINRLLTIYGVHDSDYLQQQLAGYSSEDRLFNALRFYMEKLASNFRNGQGGYSASYRIGSLERQDKYYLLLATGNTKALVLSSDIVYSVEETYQRELEAYRLKQTGQMSLFGSLDPTGEQIFEQKVQELKEDLWTACKGQTLIRRDIHVAILPKWFGRIKGTHLTKALRYLFDENRILPLDKTKKGKPMWSGDTTRFTFSA